MPNESRSLYDQTAKLGDEIARAAIDAYAALPKHGKPTIRPNGVPEWTILAAIYLVAPSTSSHRLIPISLGAGVKVLPASRLPPLGDAVHDCHAEVLARRGFVRWLILEAGRVFRGEAHEGVLEWHQGKFGLKRGVETWLYVSALPCGDASTLHTAHHQTADMSSMKSVSASSLIPDPSSLTTTPAAAIRGRNGYTAYGAIRTKPGRADSVPTISMSCSDKVASWTVLGLQGALLESIFERIKLDAVVVGGWEAGPGWRSLTSTTEEEGSEISQSWVENMKCQVQRALYGRLQHINDLLPDEYKLHRPKIHLTSIPFPHSKSVIIANLPVSPSTPSIPIELSPTVTVEPVPTVTSLSYIPALSQTPQILFNGTRTGGKWKSPGTELISERARSAVCKYDIFRAFLELIDVYEAQIKDETKLDQDSTVLPLEEGNVGQQKTYFQYKHPTNSTYQEAKSTLRGVPSENVELPEIFAKCGTFAATVGEPGRPVPPFAGWLVSGKAYEEFTIL
ncbi:domain-domain-containing protein [Naematelia encephala]|uniref:Domain-domain-containing protein n=1 Tax=Naematelia encephala TaxID=71784 RepID=A0A1Y2BAU1_9TREE|nr:domain-domain-containing protein [Naematelia encephala]